MRQVPVWFDTLHVADIEVAPDGALSLRYTERWRLADGAFPLSVTMPLRAAPYPSEVIAPWLANLLPEEEQLRILTRSLGIDQADGFLFRPAPQPATSWQTVSSTPRHAIARDRS